MCQITCVDQIDWYYFLAIIYLSSTVSFLKGCCSQHELKNVDQSLSNSALYGHRCLEKSKNYTKRLANVMIKSSIMKWLNTPWYPLLKDLLKTVQCHMENLFLIKQPNVRKLLCKFTETLDVKPNIFFLTVMCCWVKSQGN